MIGVYVEIDNVRHEGAPVWAGPIDPWQGYSVDSPGPCRIYSFVEGKSTSPVYVISDNPQMTQKLGLPGLLKSSESHNGRPPYMVKLWRVANLSRGAWVPCPISPLHKVEGKTRLFVTVKEKKQAQGLYELVTLVDGLPVYACESFRLYPVKCSAQVESSLASFSQQNGLPVAMPSTSGANEYYWLLTEKVGSEERNVARSEETASRLPYQMRFWRVAASRGRGWTQGTVCIDPVDTGTSMGNALKAASDTVAEMKSAFLAQITANAPKRLKVTCPPLRKYDGIYVLTANVANGYPYWQQGELKLFCGLQGHWSFTEKTEGMAKGVASIRSHVEHKGLLPHQVSAWCVPSYAGLGQMTWLPSHDIVVQGVGETSAAEFALQERVKELVNEVKNLKAVTTSGLLETWENQRYIPTQGWSSQLLPTDRPEWSHENGMGGLYLRDDATAPKDCDWDGSWVIDMTATGKDGWTYAPEFPPGARMKFKVKRVPTDMVRRRRWIRKFKANLTEKEQLGTSISALALEDANASNLEMSLARKRPAHLKSKFQNASRRLIAVGILQAARNQKKADEAEAAAAAAEAAGKDPAAPGDPAAPDADRKPSNLLNPNYTIQEPHGGGEPETPVSPSGLPPKRVSLVVPQDASPDTLSAQLGRTYSSLGDSSENEDAAAGKHDAANLEERFSAAGDPARSRQAAVLALIENEIADLHEDAGDDGAPADAQHDFQELALRKISRVGEWLSELEDPPGDIPPAPAKDAAPAAEAPAAPAVVSRKRGLTIALEKFREEVASITAAAGDGPAGGEHKSALALAALRFNWEVTADKRQVRAVAVAAACWALCEPGTITSPSVESSPPEVEVEVEIVASEASPVAESLQAPQPEVGVEVEISGSEAPSPVAQSLPVPQPRTRQSSLVSIARGKVDPLMPSESLQHLQARAGSRPPPTSPASNVSPSAGGDTSPPLVDMDEGFGLRANAPGAGLAPERQASASSADDASERLSARGPHGRRRASAAFQYGPYRAKGSLSVVRTASQRMVSLPPPPLVAADRKNLAGSISLLSADDPSFAAPPRASSLSPGPRLRRGSSSSAIPFSAQPSVSDKASQTRARAAGPSPALLSPADFHSPRAHSQQTDPEPEAPPPRPSRQASVHETRPPMSPASSIGTSDFGDPPQPVSPRDAFLSPDFAGTVPQKQQPTLGAHIKKLGTQFHGLKNKAISFTKRRRPRDDAALKLAALAAVAMSWRAELGDAGFLRWCLEESYGSLTAVADAWKTRAEQESGRDEGMVMLLKEQGLDSLVASVAIRVGSLSVDDLVTWLRGDRQRMLRKTAAAAVAAATVVVARGVVTWAIRNALNYYLQSVSPSGNGRSSSWVSSRAGGTPVSRSASFADSVMQFNAAYGGPSTSAFTSHNQQHLGGGSNTLRRSASSGPQGSWDEDVLCCLALTSDAATERTPAELLVSAVKAGVAERLRMPESRVAKIAVVKTNVRRTATASFVVLAGGQSACTALQLGEPWKPLPGPMDGSWAVSSASACLLSDAPRCPSSHVMAPIIPSINTTCDGRCQRTITSTNTSAFGCAPCGRVVCYNCCKTEYSAPAFSSQAGGAQGYQHVGQRKHAATLMASATTRPRTFTTIPPEHSFNPTSNTHASPPPALAVRSLSTLSRQHSHLSRYAKMPSYASRSDFKV
ncbi:rabGTPase-activating protein [Diplonema papillatum]|nr:rabGTPase-activating protein [Diplonema papillatum]